MKLCTLKIARYLYDKYNRKYFAGKLPKDVEFYWGSTCPYMTRGGSRKFNRGYYGKTSIWAMVGTDEEVYTIALSDKLKPYLNFLAQTVLHEMVHVELHMRGYGSAGHGHRFKARKRRLMRMGAYDEWT